MQSHYDVAIVGGGPAGLACACLAAASGLRVVVAEKSGEQALAAPAPDGRDIALTHRSLQILTSIGAWAEIPPEEVSPIARAAVRNAASADLLSLDSAGTGRDALGFLVANNVIRAALYRRVKATPGIDLVTGVEVHDLQLRANHARLSLRSAGGGGEASLTAALAVAADSRFSALRRMAGIGAEMRDFGRVCIVCRMRHAESHDGTAYEWFDTDQTLAVLPLNGRLSSIVVTIPSSEQARVMGMSPQAFAADVERRFSGKWGGMQLVGERHPYPLVAVFAHTFSAHRFALVGDAAVGMHPVTAHGYNIGLAGARRLVTAIGDRAAAGFDIGDAETLASYAREHSRASWPLYTATNAMVALYTDNGPIARVAREALLRIGNFVAPARHLLIDKLTEIDDAAPMPPTAKSGTPAPPPLHLT